MKNVAAGYFEPGRVILTQRSDGICYFGCKPEILVAVLLVEEIKGLCDTKRENENQTEKLQYGAKSSFPLFCILGKRLDIADEREAALCAGFRIERDDPSAVRTPDEIAFFHVL